MIIVGKKPISALKLLHSINHTQTRRFCNIHTSHQSHIKNLSFSYDTPIYNLHAGLYKISINGINYIIDIYYDLTDADHLIIKSKNDINITRGATHYPVIAYEIKSTFDDNKYELSTTVNDNVDGVFIVGKTTVSDTSGDLTSPINISRLSSFNIITNNNDGEYDNLKVYLKHTLGCLPNNVKDLFMLNADRLVAHEIINTSYEILSGGLDWKYMESYSTSEYYVFFAEYPKIKLNNSASSMRCSNFEVVACSTLLAKSTKKNCIASSYGSFGNGIWIKIAASVLDIHGDKDFAQEMQKWILMQAVSTNPIYIEYELSNTLYNTILLDEYHIKTWYPNTIIEIDGNYPLSVFYKTL